MPTSTTRILIADDEAFFRKTATDELGKVDVRHGKYEVAGQASDGKELVHLARRHSDVSLVITDLRMPTMDGLSALVILRKEFPSLRVIIASSESAAKMKALQSTESNVGFEKGITLIEKIALRVRAGQSEPGKINQILEGCERLGLNPFKVAEHYGAIGFIQKPFSAKKLEDLLARSQRGEAFVQIAI